MGEQEQSGMGGVQLYDIGLILEELDLHGGVFWDEAMRFSAEARLDGLVEKVLGGEAEPKVWIFLDEVGNTSTRIVTALAVARSLSHRGRKVLLLDGDDEQPDLTRWAGRYEDEGWIDYLRYGASLASCCFPLPWDRQAGRLIGVGSFCPTHLLPAEAKLLASRLRLQTDDLLIVAPLGPLGDLWLKEVDAGVLCWNRLDRSVAETQALAAALAAADTPPLGLVGFGVDVNEWHGPDRVAATGTFVASDQELDALTDRLVPAGEMDAEPAVSPELEPDLPVRWAGESDHELGSELPAADMAGVGSEPEPVDMGAPEPEPGFDSTPVVEPEPEPAADFAAEPAVEPPGEPELDSDFESGLESDPAPEPDPEPVPEPDPEPGYEPVAETVTPPAPEFEPEYEPISAGMGPYDPEEYAEEPATTRPRLLPILVRTSLVLAVVVMAIGLLWIASSRQEGGTRQPELAQQPATTDISQSTGNQPVEPQPEADSGQLPGSPATGATDLEASTPTTGQPVPAGQTETDPETVDTMERPDAVPPAQDQATGSAGDAATTSAPDPYSVPVGQAGWALHLYSVSSEASAEKMVRQLARFELPAAWRLREVPGKGRWYRVYVGSFPDQRSAQEAIPDLLERTGEQWAMAKPF
ncbi:MAG: SPOR domain-containing protein [bacterium]